MQTNLKYLLLSFVIVLTFTSLKAPHTVEDRRDDFIIMIDPGHGGRDSGTPGTKRYKTAEKDIALDVSLALGKMIREKLPNVKVVYTRTKDVFPTLQSRPVAANKHNADLFISIHCNAQPGKGTAYGSETYVLGLHKEATSLEVAKRENSVIFLEEDYEERYQGYDPNSPESLIGLMLMQQEEFVDQSIQLAKSVDRQF